MLELKKVTVKKEKTFSLMLKKNKQLSLELKTLIFS